MIRKKPALGLDPRLDTGFPKSSCSIEDPERDGESMPIVRACVKLVEDQFLDAN
jgi:hypothetical protein